MEPKQKQCPVLISARSKVLCCTQQYCIGTWNVRSMDQGKVGVVKQEMARVNINILGISELKWAEIGKFNSNDWYTYYHEQESLIRNGIALIVNKGVQNTFSSVQLLSHVWLLVTPWITACQASLSSTTNSWSLLKLMSIESVMPSHPLSSPSPPAPNPSQHQGLFQCVNSSHEVAKVLEFQRQHQSFQWTPRTDLL